MVFLHGILDLEIIEGKGLPNVDASLISFKKDVSDPYVKVDILVGGEKTCRIASTSVIDNNLNPHWGEKFRIDMCHWVEALLFTVNDVDAFKTNFMCSMLLNAEDLQEGKIMEGWFPLSNKKGKPKGSLNVAVSFKPLSSHTLSNEVPNSVYPLRTGCNVKLYQDAHTPAVPPITDVPTSKGNRYEPPQLWIDITNAIEKAKKLIYVVGWSVQTDIRLLRDSESETLGELLKRKANEGVKVMVMVWNESMSTAANKKGVMGTHDEDTRIFFQDTKVDVYLATRQKTKGNILKDQYISTIYSHHQKCVILDAEINGSSKRRLVAYAGGIDLTGGRWDTPEHPLFKTLPTQHKQDFYNQVCKSNVKAGPRQPWHDIHLYVEGAVAYDLLSNFGDRWLKQAVRLENKLFAVTKEDFDLDWQPSIKSPWSVQFFRSINSDSVQFNANASSNLLTDKGRLYDNSIHKAYVHHIRKAKRFIYIENQYFLGSSHGWLDRDPKCPNLVPMELVRRIVSAINAGEDFRVYVVMPMFPEGDPNSVPIQEILYWQYCTMEMMYRKIATAIEDAKIDAHPSDYLVFFCLGKREGVDDIPEGLKQPDSGTVAAKAYKHKRFMIYVHSKMAVFDDEYIIVGSANINERSMCGNRDSEMALGAFQPRYTREKCGKEEVAGDIRTFRLALWAEHCGKYMDEHLLPSSLSCMTAMKELAENNLKRFLSPEPEHNASHLLSYPLLVNKNGHVEAHPDCKKFPDIGGSVIGKKSGFLPDDLTM